MGIWMVGEPLPVDRLMSFPVRLPETVAMLEREAPQVVDEPQLPVLTVPPVSGKPKALATRDNP
jgi:hypothetical protein